MDAMFLLSFVGNRLSRSSESLTEIVSESPPTAGFVNRSLNESVSKLFEAFKTLLALLKLIKISVTRLLVSNTE